ncbi:uncharacterized protein LOC129779040 [Toxorhynchites rutilus septentrionalis]|uniref:uncharacterized protein LOC129779040 n=1 Tax=Toxorhynchites rutilus septentrionalis TaxID=329112 RepID=UPI00247B287D|nr:uncharacterized protein LOC129779040 [Toxorhynchites rutilus septentrionalis]
MLRPSALLICALALATTTQGVVNSEAQRREAPIADTYGLPPSSPAFSLGELPVAVYGTPAVAHYPPPPPDIPPPAPHGPSKEYGVPVQNFGPPKINIEYGPPHIPKPSFHHPPKPVYGPPHHPHHSAPPRKQSSLFESLFSSIGFGGEQAHHHGPPPKQVYGPPAHSFPKPTFGGPSLPQLGPKPVYGPPKQIFGPQKNVFGPQKTVFAVQQSFGHHQGASHLPPTPPEIKCDGWKPIAGPAVQTTSHLEIHAPESSYGPPPSGDFLANHQQSSSLDIGLQLPHIEPGPSFNNDLHHELDFGKGNSLEIHSNVITDSYSAPPVDSYAPNKYRPSFFKPGPPHGPPKFQLPPPSFHGAPHRPGPISHGLAISHGSVSGNLKPWSGPVSPPRQPIVYRPPVPQGLIESIGNTVEHLDNFGTKPNYAGDVYLPPPTTGDASSYQTVPHINSLPSENPPQPFLIQHHLPEALPQIQQPRHQEQQTIIAVANDCGHGPELQSNGGDSQSSLSYYSTTGSQSSSSFGTEYSNNIDTSYGPPPSGSINEVHSNNQLEGSFIQQASGLISEIHSTEHIHDSYAPPASGDSYSSHQLQGSESIATASLPGLTGGLNGLELVSAQRSQSVTIPVQGKHASYQLQFQSADPVGSGNGSGAPHEQILSEGLLQSILSAIEQPQTNFRPEEPSYDPNIDHSEVSVFLKSPEGQKTLADPPSSADHKR